MEQSQRLGRAACAVLYSVSGQLLRTGVGLVLESDFYHTPADEDLGIPTLLVDTTDGYRPDYPDIVAFIDSHRATRRTASHGRPR